MKSYDNNYNTQKIMNLKKIQYGKLGLFLTSTVNSFGVPLKDGLNKFNVIQYIDRHNY